MKATLEFNLPEDQEDFQDAQDGAKYKLVLDTLLTEVLRPIWKHGAMPKFTDNKELTDEQKSVVSEWSDDLAHTIIPELLSRFNVKLY